MAIVLIVSRTQMANGICVGGINEDTNKLIRIHNDRGGNLTFDAPYQIGDRWEMIVEKAWNARTKPHVEDMQTAPIRKIGNVSHAGIIHYIKTHFLGKQLIIGKLQDTFEGCLHLNGTQNFITKDNIPSFSTQFWIADKNLIHKDFSGKHYYIYNNDVYTILKNFTIPEFKQIITKGQPIHIIKTMVGKLVMRSNGKTIGIVNGDEIPQNPVISFVNKGNNQLYLLHEEETLPYEEIRIKFVGYQNPIDIIPQGSVIRLSLANWWNTDNTTEDRCYLQLSGWYI